MARIDWYLEGVSFGSCNCNYSCPCQFESRPTKDHCRGFEVIRIDKGHFGTLQLAGVSAALLYAWPGLIHPPIFKPIEFEVKIEARTARVMIPGNPGINRPPDSQPGNRG